VGETKLKGERGWNKINSNFLNKNLDLNIIDENNFKKKMRDLIEVCPIVVVIIIKLINIFIAYSKKIIGDVCVIGFVTCD